MAATRATNNNDNLKLKNMYKRPRATKTTINVNNAYVGESIEAKIRRIKTNKEPIGDGAPLIYTEQSEGVIPEYDPRADKFEIMLEANEKAYEQHAADRKAFMEKLEAENKAKEGEGKTGAGGAQDKSTSTSE